MIEFYYKLVGRGWAESILISEENKTEMNISYISNALRDFINSVTVLFEGTSTSCCLWQDEPGEYRILYSVKDEILNLKVIRFKDNFSRQEDLDGELIFVGSDKLLRFGRIVSRELEKLLIEYKVEGYKELWVNHDFPIEELNRLRKSIKSYKMKNVKR